MRTEEEFPIPALIPDKNDLEPHNILLARILASGLKFHDWLWHHDKEEIEEELEKHPELNRYRMASFAMFFNRMMPSKSLLLHGRLGNQRTVTPEDLEKAELSQEQLKKIAGIE